MTKQEMTNAIEITKMIVESAIETLAKKANVSNQAIIDGLNSKKVPNLTAQFRGLVKQGMNTPVSEFIK